MKFCWLKCLAVQDFFFLLFITNHLWFLVTPFHCICWWWTSSMNYSSGHKIQIWEIRGVPGNFFWNYQKVWNIFFTASQNDHIYHENRKLYEELNHCREKQCQVVAVGWWWNSLIPKDLTIPIFLVQPLEICVTAYQWTWGRMLNTALMTPKSIPKVHQNRNGWIHYHIFKEWNIIRYWRWMNYRNIQALISGT